MMDSALRYVLINLLNGIQGKNYVYKNFLTDTRKLKKMVPFLLVSRVIYDFYLNYLEQNFIKPCYKTMPWFLSSARGKESYLEPLFKKKLLIPLLIYLNFKRFTSIL